MRPATANLDSCEYLLYLQNKGVSTDDPLPHVTLGDAYRACAYESEAPGDKYTKSLSAANEYVAAALSLRPRYPNGALAEYFKAYEMVQEARLRGKMHGYDVEGPLSLETRIIQQIKSLKSYIDAL
jgi:formylglycine-generating enzyme required for sulfatase activity